VRSGAPRALGVANRAAGIVAGGDRGEILLRQAIDAFERADAKMERARALTDLGAMADRQRAPCGRPKPDAKDRGVTTVRTPLRRRHHRWRS
jgi:hypothetical protein